MKWLREIPPWLVWGLALPLVALNGWVLVQLLEYFRQFVTIFIMANLLAFLLNYPVRGLRHWGFSRSHAILLVLLLSLSLFFVLGVTLIPVLADQVERLITQLPVWIESGNQQLRALQAQFIDRRLPFNIVALVTTLQENLTTQLQAIGGQIVGAGLGLAGIAFDFIIMTVLTFYLLLHGDRLWNGLFQWLPNGRGEKLQEFLRANFHNYFSGQAVLALMIGFSMIILFVILQVPFGLLFGLGVGVMTLIPFGAPLSICVISFLAALNSFWLGLKVLVVGLLIEQSIENAIAPRLLGRFTGLNPVWILVALLLGTRIGGVLGLVLAVPTAGFVKNTADLLREEWGISKKS